MFNVPELPYEYESLEPAISRDIMELHHSKHHQAYVDKLNAALDAEPDQKGKSLEELLTDLESVPERIRTAIRNHGGGHYNHSLFWRMMSPNGGGEPNGALADAINEKFGEFRFFVADFEEEATSLFGSGWVWLMPDLTITATPNQDNPIMEGKPAPILGLDVWEHAYYLDYKNVRPDYIKAWWDVVNWTDISERFDQSR